MVINSGRTKRSRGKSHSGKCGSVESVIVKAINSLLYAVLDAADTSPPVVFEALLADGSHIRRSVTLPTIAPLLNHVNDDVPIHLTKLEETILCGFRDAGKPIKIIALAARLGHKHDSGFRAGVKKLVGLGLLVRNEDDQYSVAGIPLPTRAD